jgi:hypothetical protein
MAGWQLLPFSIQVQEQPNWCWTAVATSVAAFFDANTKQTQCQLASEELRRTDCCSANRSPCNVYGFLASSLNRVRHLRKWRIGNVAALAEVQQEIDDELPLCARVAYEAGGAHFVTIVGYLPGSEDLVGSQLIAVEDPFRGSSNVPYDILREGHLEGRWTDTYFTRKRS